MAQMHLTPLSEVVDEVWGKTGTKERDMMEKLFKEEVNAYYLGEAIRNARKAQNLTQEQLGERIGVQRAQISRLEKEVAQLRFLRLVAFFKHWVSQPQHLIWELLEKLPCGNKVFGYDFHNRTYNSKFG